MQRKITFWYIATNSLVFFQFYYYYYYYFYFYYYYYHSNDYNFDNVSKSSCSWLPENKNLKISILFIMDFCLMKFSSQKHVSFVSIVSMFLCLFRCFHNNILQIIYIRHKIAPFYQKSFRTSYIGRNYVFLVSHCLLQTKNSK